MTEKTTMKSTLSKLVSLSLIVLLAVPLRAETRAQAKPELPPPGMANYVMVLWEEGMALPDGTKIKKKMEEPDVVKLGGRVLKKTDNRREIQLPKGVAKQLRKHPSVSYLQRIWMGESLDDWDDPHDSKAGFGISAEADTNVDWIRGYEYDGSGNVKQQTTYGYDGGGNRIPLDQDHYIYDSAGRLIRAEVAEKVEKFKYDDFGNLIEKQVEGANAMSIPVDPGSNRMIGPEYDAAGNVLTRKGSPAYEYDAMNQLVRVRPIAGYTRRMVYDADDERIGMMVVGDSLSRWTIRDFNGRVIREYRGDWAGMGPWYWQLDEIYADGKLVAGEKQPFWWFENGAVYGGVRHYHLDQVDSVRVVTNAAGDSISEHDYYPFGVTKTKTYQEQMNWGDPHLDSMRYGGHWRDFLGMLNVENTDYLDYMHARYYDPNQGRFLSVDPDMAVGKILWRPQAWNRYSYVLNNPVGHTDPTGKCFWDLCVGEGAAAYAAGAALVAATAYMLAPSAVVHGKTNGEVMVDSAIDGFQAIGKGIGNLIPGRQPTTLPPPPPPSTPSRPSTPGTTPTTGVNPSAPIQALVIQTTAGPVTIPDNYVSRPADNGKGTNYQPPGAVGNVDLIRVMDPTKLYPNGYVRIYNKHGQPTTIDGKPLGNAETHLPIDPTAAKPESGGESGGEGGGTGGTGGSGGGGA